MTNHKTADQIINSTAGSALNEYNVRGKNREHGVTPRMGEIAGMLRRIDDLVMNPPVPALPALTADNLESSISEYTNDLGSVSDHRDNAINAAQNKLTDEYRRLLFENVDKLVENIRSEFATSAAAYVEAVSKVPEGYRAKSEAGSKEYAAAVEARSALDKLVRLRTDLGKLGWNNVEHSGGSYGNAEIAPEFAATKPGTADDLIALKQTARLTDDERALNGTWVIAARTGVEFAFIRPQEAAEIAHRLTVEYITANPEALATSGAVEPFRGIR